MKFVKAPYKKEDGSKRNVELMVIEDAKDSESIKGIDFTYLTEEEQLKVQEIRTEYEKAMKPYMKAFRNFKRMNFDL